MRVSKILGTTGLALAMAIPASANAAVLITVTEVGANVEALISGSLDLTGLQARGIHNLATNVRGTSPFLGSSKGTAMAYTTLVGPASWGPGTDLMPASTYSGSIFGFTANLSNNGAAIFLDPGYVSGDPLSAALTFNNATLSSLGLTAGEYIYKAPSGDTVTFNMGAVPEPATWAMMIVGFGCVGFALRRQRKARVAVSFA